MTRLPAVGGDLNNWGTLLSAFLSVCHNADGTLFIPYGVSLQMVDNTPVVNNVLSINNNNYVQFTAPASNVFEFTDHSGNALFFANGATAAFQLGPGVTFSADDAGFVAGPILLVDASGNTILKAHPTLNIIKIEDSSGNVIASFAGTNKIATLGGGQIVNRTAVSGNYSILASDYIVAYTSTSSAFVATLPAAAAGNAGQEWVIKDESGGAATHNITVKTAGGTIDGVAGSTGLIINTNYGVLRVYSNGTNYFTR